MKNRLLAAWRILRALWYTFSRTARVLLLIFVVLVLLAIIFSSDPGFMALICLGLLALSLLSGYIIYRLLSKEIK